MDTCFGCMHRFGSGEEPELDVKLRDEVASVAKESLGSQDGEAGQPKGRDTPGPGPQTQEPSDGKSQPTSAEASGRCLRMQWAQRKGEACLLGEFLVEFEGFLRDFLVDGKVDV